MDCYQRFISHIESDLSDKIKRNFFPSSGCVNSTIWMHYMDADKAHKEKAWCQLQENATSYIEQVLEATSQLYGHQPPISKTIQIRRTRCAGHCWRSKGELMSGVHRWNLSNGRTSVGRPTRTYRHLCTDTRYCLEDLPEAMDDRDERWERKRKSVRGIRVSCTTWW